MSKVKVLLIDENEMVRILFRDTFWLHAGDQYEIELAGSLDEGEKMIFNPLTRPDIVFFDVVMQMVQDGKKITTPEAGLGLLKKIKSDPNLKNIKVVIFSGYSAKEYKSKTMKAGADMYVEKGEHLPQDFINIIDELNDK